MLETRREGIAFHLEYNHYPSIPPTPDLLDMAEEALDRFPEDAEWAVPLPPGMLYGGMDYIEAHKLIDLWHLYPFMEEEEE